MTINIIDESQRKTAKVVTVEDYSAPIFVFELAMGLWLLLKRLRPQETAAPAVESSAARAGAA